MPTAPTPGPPQRSCSALANERSQAAIGAVELVAKAANSDDTHALVIDRATYPGLTARPGSPNSTGNVTEQPRERTHRAKSATAGVIPGISAMTMQLGPSPLRYTPRVNPPPVCEPSSKSSNGSFAEAMAPV